jgi:hypothetical protein
MNIQGIEIPNSLIVKVGFRPWVNQLDTLNQCIDDMGEETIVRLCNRELSKHNAIAERNEVIEYAIRSLIHGESNVKESALVASKYDSKEE